MCGLPPLSWSRLLLWRSSPVLREGRDVTSGRISGIARGADWVFAVSVSDGAPESGVMAATGHLVAEGVAGRALWWGRGGSVVSLGGTRSAVEGFRAGERPCAHPVQCAGMHP